MTPARPPARPSARPAPHPRRPLVVTADERLLDDLLRLAAAAGATPDVAPDLGAARASWPVASLVVVGEDVLRSARGPAPPRRPDVVLVGLDLDRAEVWQEAVDVGADQVVFLPDDEDALLDRFADALDRAEGADADAVLLAVAGGRGGAGATSLAVALALAGTRAGARTLLVDADPLGGGIDLAVGAEGASGARWPDLSGSRGRVSGTALRAALPEVDALTVLSWDRGDTPSIPAEAMASVLGAARRSCDLVVADLPRRVDPAAEEVLSRARTVLLVVPAEVRATAASTRVAAGLALRCGDLRVVVRGPAPSRLPASAVAEALGLPLAGSIAPEPGIAGALERGDPPGRSPRSPLGAFASRFVGAVLAEQAAA